MYGFSRLPRLPHGNRAYRRGTVTQPRRFRKPARTRPQSVPSQNCNKAKAQTANQQLFLSSRHLHARHLKSMAPAAAEQELLLHLKLAFLAREPPACVLSLARYARPPRARIRMLLCIDRSSPQSQASLCGWLPSEKCCRYRDLVWI